MNNNCLKEKLIFKFFNISKTWQTFEKFEKFVKILIKQSLKNNQNQILNYTRGNLIYHGLNLFFIRF